MIVWRITRERYQALDDEGARVNGGRWNSEGVAVVYASTTLALAALEYLAHIDPEDVPADLVAMRIEVPDDVSTERIVPAVLPADWSDLVDHPECVKRGDAWARNARACCLRVPSALVPEEENALINPRHAEAARIVVRHVRRFAFDRRLLA